MEDKREIIELDLDHDLLFKLFMMAHEQDITFNQLIENILRAEIERIEAEKNSN